MENTGTRCGCILHVVTVRYFIYLCSDFSKNTYGKIRGMEPVAQGRSDLDHADVWQLVF